MLPVLPMNIRRYIGSCPIFLRNSLSGNRTTVTKEGRSNSSGICRSEATWQVSLGLLCQNFPCHSNCVVYSSLDLIGLVHRQKIIPFASDLFSPDVREDILIVGISRRCFDCTSHVLILYFHTVIHNVLDDNTRSKVAKHDSLYILSFWYTVPKDSNYHYMLKLKHPFFF